MKNPRRGLPVAVFLIAFIFGLVIVAPTLAERFHVWDIERRVESRRAAVREDAKRVRTTIVPTVNAPANAEELPRCTPAPVLTGQVDVWSEDRSRVESQAGFRVEATNAPCFEDFHARATDNNGNVSEAVARYYFIPQPVPTPTATPEQPAPPTPTPTPLSTPTPTPVATPTPTPPCPKGRRKKGAC